MLDSVGPDIADVPQADNGPPEAYSHPIFKELIIKTIFLSNGIGRSCGLVDACAAKLDDHESFNPIPLSMLALAATAVSQHDSTPSVAA